MDVDIPDESSQRSISESSSWMRSSVRSLLVDLGYDPAVPPVSTATTIPSIIFEYANNGLHHDTSALLDALSLLLSLDGISDVIAQHFWPICVDLLARWIGQDVGMDEWERRLSVVALLCSSTRGIWDVATAFIQSSPFSSSPLAAIPIDRLPSIPAERLHVLLIAYYRILLADPAIATRYSWPHTPLHTLRTQHSDKGVRLLAIRVLSQQRPWSEAKRIEVEKEWVGDVDHVDAPILFGCEVIKLDQGGFQVRKRVEDGWLLPVLERRRLQKVECLLQSQQEKSLESIQPHLSPRVVCVADRLLLRDITRSTEAYPFIHVSTTSTEACLRDMVPLLQKGLPCLISSTPSSGKTHLLQYLSTLLHPAVNPAHRILSIPLADTTIDIKSLIGTYISSPTKPGTFEWMEGALAKAVRAGRWIILDDIDRSSVEMLVTVAGIARSLQVGQPGRRARLAVPGREEIEAGDGFALFATRSTRQDAITPLNFFGNHLFREIHLAPPTDDEILSILSAKFPTLPLSITAILVKMWQDLRPMARVSGPVKAREIGLRDLEKWCARVVRNLPAASAVAALEQSDSGVFRNPVFQDEVLLEAVDTFMASLDSKPASIVRRNAMIEVVASAIGMDGERAMALADKRRPNLEKVSSTKQLIIGRTITPLASSSRKRAISSRPFALTKPSLILLERVAASSAMGEPTLLVGETGTGKTTAVQYIADTCGKPLTALNLSMQTESSDLLGGFKPIDASVSARLLHAKWQKLFCETFSMAKQQNGAYIEVAAKALSGRKWQRCAELWSASARRAMDKLKRQDEVDIVRENGDTSPRKRRKPNIRAVKAAVQWQALLVEVSEFDLHHVKMNSKLVFSFVEGPLVKAMKSGEWILLDEINLASQETLEAISTILEGPSASLVLTERGDVEPVVRHPDFRLFACMNPATDVGKKDLPPSLRSRFTELYVAPPDDDREALVTIVTQYIGDIAAGDKAAILDVAEMYMELKRLSSAKEIVDGANTAPHYSMRTLARSLMFAIETAPLFGLRRALWEGCLMAFTMSLDLASIERAREVCIRYLLGPMKNAKAVLSQIPSLPAGADSDDYVRFGPFWLQRGPLPPSPESRYIITPSVQAKLSDLARVVMTHRYPVLIQGPTSSGKTSAVEFLARQTGHRFVRINNHEHTDIQEYLGTYVTDPKSGNLVFQEGMLVTAVRQGHWIVLDELNLAPTDVLEALNRLLDDNRELVIPETQEVVRPHPNFILFATQNPPGLYAGRKVLSRAFRNRFLEVHFDDVPKNELETIICQRCQIAPSYAKKIVQVFEELRHRRQASRVFESKQSFATLRDLFRWAERGAVEYQQLASDGYMLLAERGRQEEDKQVIKGVIEDILKVTIDDRGMYDLFEKTADNALTRLPFSDVPQSTLVWTRAMERLFTLVASALANNEPVLLVGETGCGKTSVCDIIALAFGQKLVGVNCHQNMETADLLGSQRPVRNRLERKTRILARLNDFAPLSMSASDDEISTHIAQLRQRLDIEQIEVSACEEELTKLSALFEWSDGPLVHAMNQGDLLLLDEVSLADDSVLERLNSVLEPGRTLVLAEKGGSDIDAATIVAHSNFHVVATMNPGGDFGKKELSPALRNRFTEIWVPPLNDRQDLLQIIGLSWKDEQLQQYGPLILDFFTWFGERIADAAIMGLRDILAWVGFMNQITKPTLHTPSQAFRHGGQMTVVDGLESLPQCAGMSTSSVDMLRNECLTQLTELCRRVDSADSSFSTSPSLEITPTEISVGEFGIARGSVPQSETQFHFNAPTTALNAMRVLRGCQLPKAILLEGSPGVGKTSLVSALAAVAGFRLQRINLSDQTDLIDLFGTDLPVEGGQAGEFRWRDAAFLDAMQKGDWVLLDEMNLASQTVLEGLNAVLDYRGTVYIPELGRSFARHPSFRVFAAQNPLQQGGGRKGLPKSFLNRFTKVYLQEHTAADLLMICQTLYPMPSEMVQKMIAFNEEIRIGTTVTRTLGREGSPWEFNLRDLFRWFGVFAARNGLESIDHPAEFLRMIYVERFRSSADREAVVQIFDRVFGITVAQNRPLPLLSPKKLQIGHSTSLRASSANIPGRIRNDHLEVAESILKAVELGWLVILAGGGGGGKRSLVRLIAGQAGRSIGEFTMHPGVDTSEILGSFEQQDHRRLVRSVYSSLIKVIDAANDTSSAVGGTRLEMARMYQRLMNGEDVLDDMLSSFRAILDGLAPSEEKSVLLSAVSRIAQIGVGSSGFAWVDGQLIDALRSGGWYLISDANLCSPSVLDRLNSLCESNGSLILSEKGSSSDLPEVIIPHPEFRLFMIYDPRHGELSRAMRNRGIELYITEARCSGNAALPNAIDLTDSLLHAASFAGDVDVSDPSVVANELAVSLREALPMSSRLISARSESADLAGKGLLYIRRTNWISGSEDGTRGIVLVDPSLATTRLCSADAIIFRATQTFLRIEKAEEGLRNWLIANGTGKTTLALSSASDAGRRSKRAQPEAKIPALINALRKRFKMLLGQHQTSRLLDGLDRAVLLVQHMETRCKTDVFDYSAIATLAEWLKETVEVLPEAEETLEIIKQSIDHVQTTTGLGQAEIWSLFRGTFETKGVVSSDLLQTADSCSDLVLRRMLLESILAMQASEEHISVPAEMADLLQSIPSGVPLPHIWSQRPVMLLVELLSAFGNEMARRAGLNILLSDGDVRISAILPFATIAEDTSELSYLKWTSSWLQRTWEPTSFPGDEDTLDGPALLLSPVQLLGAIRFCLSESLRLDHIRAADAALASCIQVTLYSTRAEESRHSAILTSILASIRLILSAFGLPGPQNRDVFAQAKTLASSLRSSPAPHVRESGQRHLIPHLLGQPGSSSLDVGRLSLGLSRFLIDLYVTSVPIDPAVRRVLQFDLLASYLLELRMELQAIEDADIRTKGVSDSPRRSGVIAKITETERSLSELGPAIARSQDAGSDAARLAYMFNEIQAFLKDMFAESSIDNLVEALIKGDHQAFHREKSFQMAADAFIVRLDAIYADMQDLIQPVVTALLFARFGLRCIAREAEQCRHQADQTLLAALAFPRATVVTQLHGSPSPSTAPSSSNPLISAYALAVETVNDTQRHAHLSSLVGHLERLYNNWSAIRTKEQYDEQAKESLFRVKKTEVDVLSDIELEEKEFAELFPQYDPDASSVVEPKATDSEDESFPAKTMEDFHHLVMSLFGGQRVSVQSRLSSLLRASITASFDHRPYGADLDTTSIVWQIETLYQRSRDSQKSIETPNFYTGANEPETRKAADIASRLGIRLTLLIDEWPEQMILQHIKDRCDRFMSLDIRSPVAMVLTNLEQLLVHIDDWEPYASRDNSLKSYQSEISSLLINWRRLELSSWTRLLDDQALQYIAKDAEWTLQLFGALISASRTAEDIGKHLDSLVPMITSYLQSSTLGSFASRLQLLDCFCRMANELRENANLVTVQALLSNILKNARLFAPRIEESVRVQRAVIDKAIRDFVKLASWKDVNIFALRASAQKSHKQLHKNIRRFRDVLQQPVAPMLSDLTVVVPQLPAQMESLNESTVFDISALPSTPFVPISQSASLVRLPETLNRFAQLLIARSSTHLERVATAADSMAVDIIETAAQLASATPSTLTKENTKVIANLASRKRKAFSDMLKALRASGFSQSVRADFLAKQQSTPWMLKRLPLPLESMPDALVTVARSIEMYDTKLGVILPALRAAFNGHNPDIASPDLQRGIGFTESLLATCLVERDRLVNTFTALNSLSSKLNRLRLLAQAKSLEGGRDIYNKLVETNLLCCRVRQAFLEGKEAIRRHRELEGKPVLEADLAMLHAPVLELDDLIPRVDDACASARQSSYYVVTSGDSDLLRRADEIRLQLTDALSSEVAQRSDFAYLYSPLHRMIAELPVLVANLPSSPLATAFHGEVEDLISAILVVAQRIPEAPAKEDDPDYAPNTLQAYSEQTRSLGYLRLPEVMLRLDGLMDSLSRCITGHTTSDTPLAYVLPFLEALGESYARMVSQHAFAVKSSYKLCYVVARVMLDLAQKGFCKPQEESESKEGEGEETVEGSGMGSGTGDKNVSSEIEEEGQVEGLQGEKQEEGEKQDEEGEDDAVDMEDDFEGELGEGKEKDKEEGEEGSEEEEDHDEHAGDVDPLDPGAVDEKFWGEEDNEDGKDGGKDEVMDQQGQDDGGDTEMTAKEEEKKGKDQEKKGKESGETKEENGEQQDAIEEGEGDGAEDEEEDRADDERQEDQPGRPDEANVNVEESERLDLPDDINLDGDESDHEVNPDDDISLPPDEREEDEEMGHGDDASVASQDDGEADEDGPATTGVGEEDTEEQDETMGQNVDLSAADDAHAQESSDQGQGKGGSSEEQQKEQQKDGENGQEEPDVEAATEEPKDGEGSAPQNPSSGSADQQAGEGAIDSSGAPIPSDTRSQPQANRSLGDILKDIRRRRDEILAQQERQQEVDDRQDAQAEASGQVEYLHEGDADEGQQALGAAGEEERQKLEDLNILDEEDMDGPEADGAMPEDQEEVADEPQEQTRPDQASRSTGPADQQASEKALTRADIQGSAETTDAGEQMDLDDPEGTEEAKDEPTDEEALFANEVELNEDAGVVIEDQGGEDRWRKYASLTSDLSYALCEQLRLILEPTLATRLQGDFRTGKRLNMRKIIPYIASEYTKDKIWLRRTKPSRREYQVLLSLDDSRSMAESHSVDLAYQTLALVAQALNKLEVGQIGIAKFGESVDILHPFGDTGFTDADGAKVMKSFRFDQQKTDVAALVERTLGFLAEARQKQSSTSAPDLWQLQIIISDGVCQDHHRLRTLLRRALEERVMIVFLVVDSLQQTTPTANNSVPASGAKTKGPRPSILSMQTVEYKNVGGNMQLEMTRYLDTFPFEYYVVLRDVEALPGVLADTLRQWMARVSQSQE